MLSVPVETVGNADPGPATQNAPLPAQTSIAAAPSVVAAPAAVGPVARTAYSPALTAYGPVAPGAMVGLVSPAPTQFLGRQRRIDVAPDIDNIAPPPGTFPIAPAPLPVIPSDYAVRPGIGRTATMPSPSVHPDSLPMARQDIEPMLPTLPNQGSRAPGWSGSHMSIWFDEGAPDMADAIWKPRNIREGITGTAHLPTPLAQAARPPEISLPLEYERADVLRSLTRLEQPEIQSPPPELPSPGFQSPGLQEAPSPGIREPVPPAAPIAPAAPPAPQSGSESQRPTSPPSLPNSTAVPSVPAPTPPLVPSPAPTPPRSQAPPLPSAPLGTRR